MTKLSVHIKRELLREFKIACARAGIDMSAVVIAAIKEYISSKEGVE